MHRVSDSLRARFRDFVTSEAALRAVVGGMQRHALDKVIREIEDHRRRFIAAAPRVLIASMGEDGSASAISVARAGVRHRPAARGEARVALVAPAGTANTGGVAATEP